MNASELEQQIKNLEHIREILLNAGIRSVAIDASFQRVCNCIDELYGLLLAQHKADVDMPSQ